MVDRRWEGGLAGLAEADGAFGGGGIDDAAALGDDDVDGVHEASGGVAGAGHEAGPIALGCYRAGGFGGADGGTACAVREE